MRTLTSAQRTTVSASALDIYAKLEITDADGAWKDVSTALSTPDWFNSCQITESIDQNTCSFSAELLRDAGSLSLAPLREDSTINRNSVPVYAPMLDLHRQWRVSVAVMGDGVAASGYKEIGKGYVDSIDVNDQRPTIQVAGRGLEAALLDQEIDVEAVYSASSTSSLETVIQQVIDANWNVSYGAAPTVYVPVPTGFVINKYTQQKQNLMAALQALAETKGAVLRYRYDSADVNRLTLFVPNREATAGSEVWTIGPTEYLGLPLNRLDITGVRNYVTVNYTGGLVISPFSSTSGSITTYGKRPMTIDLSSDTQITTAARAQAFADAIRADLEFPSLQQRFASFGFWFVQLTDYCKLTQNGVHYNVDQSGGVTAYTHSIGNGTMRTTVDLGGKPKGGYAKWRPIGEPTLPKFPGIPDTVFKFFPVTPYVPPAIGSGPAGVNGCKLWLKADDLLATTSDGGYVGFWPDASANGKHAVQATTGRQPTLSTNQVNTYPVVKFDGSDDFLLTPNVITPTVSPGSTLFWVLKKGIITDDNEVFFSFQNGSETDGVMTSTILEHGTADAGKIKYQQNEALGSSVIGTTSSSVFKIYALSFASTSSVIPYVNGVAGTSFDPYFAVETNVRKMLRLGRVGGTFELYAAAYDMAEVAWFEGVLSTADRNAVTAYLNSKYSIY